MLTSNFLLIELYSYSSPLYIQTIYDIFRNKLFSYKIIESVCNLIISKS